MGGFKRQKLSKGSSSNQLGLAGERAVLAAYLKRGFRVVGRNLVNAQGLRWGELDLVVRNNDTIIFVEVKTRTKPSSAFGHQRESVPAAKVRKMMKTVNLFLARYPQYRHLRPQVDICFVTPTNLDKTRFSVTILVNAVRD